MDLQSLIAAYLISQGAHTAGHFRQGSNPDQPMRDVKMSLYAKDLVEKWERPKTVDNARDAKIHGAGFYSQDRVRDSIEDPELKKQAATVNAIMKALYLAEIPNKLSKKMGKRGGDINGMERTSGNHYTKELVAASILEDLRQANNPDDKLSYGFDVVDGAPGGRVTYRW